MKRLSLVLLIGLMLVIVSTALAQSGSGASTSVSTGYDLSWNTIDSGGDTSIGGDYSLMGTIGQSDAGPLMNGGSYALAGGFWASRVSQYHVFLPIMIK